MKFLTVGNRIALRKVLQKDANKNYLLWLNDYEINKFMETRHYIHSIPKIKNFIKNCSKENSLLLAICTNKNNKHIGNIKIGPINNFHQTAEISYFIGEKSEWGKGYATEAVNLAVNYSFNKIKLFKFYAGIYKSNLSSSKVLSNSGFKIEAKIEKAFKFETKREDHIIYSITNDNYYE